MCKLSMKPGNIKYDVKYEYMKHDIMKIWDMKIRNMIVMMKIYIYKKMFLPLCY